MDKPLTKADIVKKIKTILQCTSFCSLCFDTKGEILHLDTIEDFELETLTLRQLLDAILGDTQHILTSDFICEVCKSMACSSYAFIQKTKRSICSYTKYLDQLNRETSELLASFDTDWKRAVIVLEDNEKILEPEETNDIDTIKKYICDKCGKEYIRKTFLIKHLKKHKSECSKSCPHCNIRPCVHEKYILAFYEQQQLKIEPLSCICGYNFGKTLDSLIAHVNKEHLNIKPNICEACGKSFYVESQYQKHYEHHHNNKFKSMRHLKQHLKSCTVTENLFQYRKCSAEFDIKVLKQNKKTKIYKCLICDKILKTKLQLRSHINNTHEKKPNLCMYCNKQYNSRQEYLDHVQSEEHKNNIPYAFRHHCEHCDYSANTITMLKAHINRIHLNVRPFECEHCHKRYFDSTQLSNHIKTHTGQRKLKVCDICGANLAGPTALKKHRRLHTGEYPYSCPYCEVKTNCASSLKTHIMRKHMEPTIQCPLCDLKFHTMVNARGHVKKTHWKSKEKFDYTKLDGLTPEDYDFFRDRRKAVV